MLLSLAASAQIPNAGFETWFNAGSFEEAQGWASYNPYTQFASVTTVSKTTDAHSGTYAALAETKSFFNTLTGMQDTVPGVMVTGPDVLSSINGFPFTLRPDSLSAWYKYSLAGNDFAGIGVLLSKWNGTSGARDYIASGEISITASAANYTYGSAPLSYFMPDFPDTAFVYISASNGSIAFPGSAVKVDDISLVTLVGIEKAQANSIHVTAYPNPATEKIQFKISAPAALTIFIYDLPGRSISAFNTEGKFFANVDVRNYDAGIYFYVAKEKNGSRKASGKFCVIK